MGGLSIWHWLIVLLVVVLIFGTKKLRNIGQDLGGAVKGFKEGMKGAETEADAAKTAEAPPGADRRDDDRRRGQEGKRRRRAVRPASGAAARHALPPNAPRPTLAATGPCMFDIGFSEIVVIAVVALIVIGPERLPKAARDARPPVRPPAALRRDVKADINRELELEELRKLQHDVQSAAKDIETTMSNAARDVESGTRKLESELNAVPETAPSTPSVEASAPAPAAAPAAPRLRHRDAGRD